tara:strand:+ start:8899 stop:9018 length:120 start_codon:yes stop_codon:yes gene_type:complete
LLTGKQTEEDERKHDLFMKQKKDREKPIVKSFNYQGTSE